VGRSYLRKGGERKRNGFHLVSQATQRKKRRKREGGGEYRHNLRERREKEQGDSLPVLSFQGGKRRIRC